MFKHCLREKALIVQSGFFFPQLDVHPFSCISGNADSIKGSYEKILRSKKVRMNYFDSIRA